MMNYREIKINDSSTLHRLATGAYSADTLCDELSQLTVVKADIQSTGGIFSRLKSSIFSSHEHQIRTEYVASCKVQLSSGGVVDRVLHLCITGEGRCSLLNTVAGSNPPTAVEVAFVDLPRSGEVYFMSSVYLGTSQGSLCVVSVGQGRIVLLSVNDNKVTLTKTIALPVTVPITGVSAYQRERQVELSVVLDRQHLLVLPDITKSSVYSFGLLQNSELKIKEFEYSTVSEDCMRLAWESHKAGKKSVSSPAKSTLLLGTKYSPFSDYLDFQATFLLERILELLQILQLPALPSVVKADIAGRVRDRIGPSMDCARIIREEAELVCSQMSAGSCSQMEEIDQIGFDVESQKTFIQYRSGRITELVCIDSRLERFVNSFLSVPITSQLVDRRTSRESALELFPDQKSKWANVFACACVGESLTSGFLSALEMVPLKLAQTLIAEQLKRLPAETAGHIRATVAKCSNLTPESIFEEINSDLANPASQAGVSALFSLAKYYLVLTVYLNKSVDSRFGHYFSKLRTAQFLLAHFSLSVPPGTSLGDLLENLHLVFLSESPEVGFLASACEARFETFANFHRARLGGSLQLFAECEMEVSLVANRLGASPFRSDKPQFQYWWFVAHSLSDYEAVMSVFEKHLVSVGEESWVQKICFEKAVAAADWPRVKRLLNTLADRQWGVRLMCSEARIRNELSAVLDLVREDLGLVKLIVGEIEEDLGLEPNACDQFPYHFQIFNLSVFANHHAKALATMMASYASLLCPFTRPGSEESLVEHYSPHQFSWVEVNSRLTLQVQALVLARCVVAKGGATLLHYLNQRLAFAEGLLALYSFASAAPVLVPSSSGVSVTEVTRSLSAVGLILASFKIACLFRLNTFSACVLPFLELLKSENLPPCRIAADAGGSVDLMPAVTPSMAFPRSDVTGPLGTGGNQRRAMLVSLEQVLRKSAIHTVLECAEHMCAGALPAFLVSLLEEKNLWTHLLKLHMRRENWRECVRLVEAHVKFWQPSEADLPMAVVNVPLLVQLERALEVSEESDERDELVVKLRDALGHLKHTLSHIGERMII